MTAFEVLPEYPQDSPEWHAARLDSLGASEVPAVLGLSKWQTPLSVWNAKRGIPNVIDEDRAYFGHALEPVIAGWITRKHPEVGYVGAGFSARSKAWPWLSASPDRIATDDGQPVPIELKTGSAYVAGDWKDGPPLNYQAQVQAQIAVLGAPYGWLAVLIDGNRPALHRLERDDAFIEDMVRITGDFWRNHVLALVAPDPTSPEEAALLWPGKPGVAVEGGPHVREMWEEYGYQQRVAAEAAEKIDALKLQLLVEMGDATTLTYGDRPLFTWNPRKGSTRLDTTALRQDLPDVAEKYTRQGEPTRVFQRVKAKESK